MLNWNQLKLEIAASPADAPDYKNSEFKIVNLDKAIVVRNGMESGNDTVDLQFVDADGNKYVALITARLLKTATDVCITTN